MPQKIMTQLKIIAIAATIALASCSTSKGVHKLSESISEKNNAASILKDNSATTTTITGQQTTLYGDTLNGSLSFTSEQAAQIESNSIDSMESNGVKVKVAIIPFKGGFKTKIQAIAKPQKGQNNYSITKTDQKAVENSNRSSNNKVVSVTEREVEKKSYSMGVLWIIIVTAIFFFINQHKKFIWQNVIQKILRKLFQK